MDDTLQDAAACEAVGLDPDATQWLWESFQRGAPGIYWSRVWLLFVLIDWCRRHNVTMDTNSHADRGAAGAPALGVAA